MLTNLKAKFKNHPDLYYAMSIAATWAGVGSLMMGMTVAQDYGIVPYLIWAAGNTLACIVFGLVAPYVPRLRDVFRSKIMKVIVGLMCPFQIWISLNGMQQIFANTPLTVNFGTGVAVVTAVLFIVLLYRYGMIRNVLTDHMSWVLVYILVAALAVVSMIYTRGSFNLLSAGMESINVGVEKAMLLIPGAFLYPYYFEILDYNDRNEDGTKKINIRKAFINGGLLFGAYLAITFLLAWTRFSPALNIVKAVLITLIAISSLSSFQYSLYITFGRKLGLALNIVSLILWPLVISLGVMGVWTMMAKVRIMIVFVAIAAALWWAGTERYVAKHKAVSK